MTKTEIDNYTVRLGATIPDAPPPPKGVAYI